MAKLTVEIPQELAESLSGIEERIPELLDHFVGKLENMAKKNNRTLEEEVTAILEGVLKAKAWNPGFFEEVIGGWEGEPLVRGPQPEYQERDPLL